MGARVHYAVIVGAGFGGLGMAVRLAQEGIDDFVVLEAASDVGGVWRDNRYPGAGCDVPSHLYSLSFAPWPHWTRRFASQPEILAYLHHVVDAFHLTPHLRLETRLTDARFDLSTGCWDLTVSSGAILRTRALIVATGQLSRPNPARLPGLEQFEGPAFHSALWPDDFDPTDKRVAVIGTGASAIQIVPALAPKTRHLTVFQRTAPWVIPKPDHAYPAWVRRLLHRLPFVLGLSRALTWLEFEVRGAALHTLPGLLAPYRLVFRRHLARQVKDPQLRARLTPTTPLGCKRVLISNDWYPALCRSDVTLETDRIASVTRRGVVTTAGTEHEFDALVLATGFQANDFLVPIEVVGRDGQRLHDVWRDGAEAFLGTVVRGFPNLFVLYGPNTNLGHSSIVQMLESQFRYVLSSLETQRRLGVAWLDVRPQVQRAWNAWLQDRLARTVWSQGCDSWYQTAEGRQTNNWPGFTTTFRRLTREVTLRDMELGPSRSAVAKPSDGDVQ